MITESEVVKQTKSIKAVSSSTINKKKKGLSLLEKNKIEAAVGKFVYRVNTTTPANVTFLPTFEPRIPGSLPKHAAYNAAYM